MKKRLVILFVGILFMFTLIGCNSSATPPSGGQNPEPEQQQETTFERAQREGYVSVGFANEAPFAYATPAGELTGLNVEVARAVLKRLGIEEMAGQLTEFGSLIPGLMANRFDIITAGMYITPQRAQEVAFADPEYTIGGGLAVKAGNPKNLRSYDDIAADSTVKIAVMAGAAENTYLLAVGASEDQIVVVPDQPSALAALQAGRVDAITMTSAALESLITTINDASIERVDDFEISVVDGKSQQAFGSSAFRKEDEDFREAYNRELTNLKNTNEYLAIFERFGFSEHQLPGDATAEYAIANW